jgi:hypothetical protein
MSVHLLLETSARMGTLKFLYLFAVKKMTKNIYCKSRQENLTIILGLSQTYVSFI